MKKLKLFLFCLNLISISLFSQVEAGFLTGIGRTDILEKGITSEGYKAGLGYTLGGFLNYAIFKEHLFFKTALTFNEKGAYYPSYHSSYTGKGKRRENVYYLDLPLQLQFRFFPSFKLQAGIYNAIRLNMKPNEYGGFDNSFVGYDGRYDIGYTAGIIFEYKEFILEASYGKSLRSIGRISYWDENLQKFMKSDNTQFYNQTLFFTFGYKIFTGSKDEKE
ncbi:MAG: outer membrane beta-barrel protein [Bacteroidales bacterium]|nr:outer membrane beta-barrel protein [Bacteroidales bacterium]